MNRVYEGLPISNEIRGRSGSVASFGDRRARQLSQQLGELGRHLEAVAHDSAGEDDPERRIAAGALEPVRDHIDSLRGQVAQAARNGEEVQR
ncbi:MAG: hypothetical protein ACRDZ4_06600 [Egibacteraceae bacterium]